MTESSANLPPVAPGTVLAGKYRVERIIGQGGMGLVVEAKHIALDERVALKFLLPDYASHPEAAARFLREARAAVKIKSEHVARVSDVGTLDNGSPYMVMEFLEGSDLSQVLEKRGVLAIPEAIDYVVQGCEAIAEAHSHGIVHRDLKPANLFLTRRQDGYPLVKVLDFGISKTMGNVENLTKTMAAMGSALYMSPEQMQQTRSVDHRTDIYALGISLYELLAGKQPFYAETLPQLCAEILTGIPTPIRQARPDVPEALAVALERAYARDRGVRYGSIAEFVVALAPWAPAPTRPTIERVARMGGIPLLPQGDPRASMPSASTYTPQQVQQVSQQALPQQTSPPHEPPAGSQTDPNQIVLSPYQAPHSARATAAFANNTNANLSTTGPRPSSSKGVVVAIVGMMLVGSIVGAIFWARGRGEAPTPADAQGAAQQPSAAPSATTAATSTPSATATTAASASPGASASASASASAAGTTADTAAPSATAEATPPRGPLPGRHGPGRTPTPPPKKDPAKPAMPSTPAPDINAIPKSPFG
ncbi:MAG TPA: serine/threonine-protein kinase [Byssovorax sp.]